MRKRWTPVEKDLIERIFGEYLTKRGVLSKMSDIVAARIANPELKSRKPSQIKTYINNQQKSYAKNQET